VPFLSYSQLRISTEGRLVTFVLLSSFLIHTAHCVISVVVRQVIVGGSAVPSDREVWRPHRHRRHGRVSDRPRTAPFTSVHHHTRPGPLLWHHSVSICLLILVVARSATAILQHGTPFLSPLKTVRPYMVSSAT